MAIPSHRYGARVREGLDQLEVSVDKEGSDPARDHNARLLSTLPGDLLKVVTSTRVTRLSPETDGRQECVFPGERWFLHLISRGSEGSVLTSS